MPLATVEQVFGLYREKYFDLNVRHFHEKLRESTDRAELHLGEAGAAGSGAGGEGRKRGVHRKRRARRPLPGMLLHIDGSRHQWFQDERWYDLIVILDDATSEIYYAQLVEEESTVTVMAALKEVIERKGVFCALYSDRGSHFWLTPKAGGKVDPSADPGGTGIARVGSADDSGVFAAGARAQRTKLRHLAGTAAQELRLRRITPWRRPTNFCGKRYMAEFNRRFQVAAAQRGSAFVPCRSRDLEPDLLAAVRAHGESRQHGELSESQLQIERVAGERRWRAAR